GEGLHRRAIGHVDIAEPDAAALALEELAKWIVWRFPVDGHDIGADPGEVADQIRHDKAGGPGHEHGHGGEHTASGGVPTGDLGFLADDGARVERLYSNADWLAEPGVGATRGGTVGSSDAKGGAGEAQSGGSDMSDSETRQLAVGLKHSRSVRVTDEMTPAHLRSEPIRVLSTPDMIRLIEQTAIEAVAPYLA